MPLVKRNSEEFRVEWWNSTPHFALIPERRNENIKYFISLNVIRTHSRLRFQSHSCAPQNRSKLN